jgi:hypothetical protein
MWNYLPPDRIAATGVPKLYATDGVPFADKLIYLHYFLGPCDWYMAEYSKAEDLFFGYANLGDPEMAEWGLIQHAELRDLIIRPGIEVDRDLYWRVRRASGVEGIRC